MAEKTRARWSLLLALFVAPALLIGCGLAVPRTGETTSDQGTPEAQPGLETCEGYPEYAITIKGNTEAGLNGTWKLTQFKDNCSWSPTELEGRGRRVAVFCLGGNEWILSIITHYHTDGKLTGGDVTEWQAPNITGYPDGAPFEHVRGARAGGTIVVHER